MANAYIYVVDRDFGFAPNPFFGRCTLATCKPIIRRTAQIGDWVIGVGGTRLNATGKCIFAMQVTESVNFDQYWSSKQYIDKRPIRNGSNCKMVGDNIYRKDSGSNRWIQADSHHSLSDGRPNQKNIENDTQTDRVLISKNFYYFGKSAPSIDTYLRKIGYQNQRNHRVYPIDECQELFEWLKSNHTPNLILSDPFDFMESHHRYDGKTNTTTL